MKRHEMACLFGSLWHGTATSLLFCEEGLGHSKDTSAPAARSFSAKASGEGKGRRQGEDLDLKIFQKLSKYLTKSNALMSFQFSQFLTFFSMFLPSHVPCFHSASASSRGTPFLRFTGALSTFSCIDPHPTTSNVGRVHFIYPLHSHFDNLLVQLRSTQIHPAV